MLTLVLIFLVACSSTGKLKPFNTDGCSYFPDGTLDHKDVWFKCCTNHDIAYWQGGTCIQRLEADKALFQCVNSVNNPIIAKIMYSGVRIGGSPYWPTKFRWGYGWPYLRGYKTLTSEEKIQLDIYLERFHQELGID